jgi:hypothetical protein
MWVGWQITTPGTGYVVGQLITTNDQTVPAIILNPPVFRVATVDGSGGVLTLIALTVGCARLQNVVPSGPFQTLAVNGTGLTLTATSSTNALPGDNSYYAYPTPAGYNFVALQECRYYLKMLSISGVSFTILQLDAPPTAIDLAAPSGVIPQSDILMTTFAFEPPVVQLLPLGSYGYELPLTNHNLNAINLADSTNCYVNGICFFSPSYTSTDDNPNAFKFKNVYHYGGANINDHFHSWLAWYWNSVGSMFDYLEPGMTFSLHRPLMLVLPSI